MDSEWLLESDELKKEEEEMKVTAAQKEKMEKDHDKIKEYYKVVKSGKSVRYRDCWRNGRMISRRGR